MWLILWYFRYRWLFSGQWREPLGSPYSIRPPQLNIIDPLGVEVAYRNPRVIFNNKNETWLNYDSYYILRYSHKVIYTYFVAIGIGGTLLPLLGSWASSIPYNIAQRNSFALQSGINPPFCLELSWSSSYTRVGRIFMRKTPRHESNWPDECVL